MLLLLILAFVILHHIQALNIMPTCGKLYEKALSLEFVAGGYTPECQPRYISYGACLQILLNTSSPCNGFLYSFKICHLVDRTLPDFKLVHLDPIRTPSEYNHAIMVRRLTTGWDSCHDASKDLDRSLRGSRLIEAYKHRFNRGNSSSNFENDYGNPVYRNGHLVAAYKKCISNKKIQNHLYLPEEEFNKLPRLNILISLTPNWAHKDPAEFKKVMDHWKCYAANHGYLITFNYEREVTDSNDFFVARHESLRKIYLQKSQYTLHIDADSMILDMSKSLEPFLQLNRSVLLQMRENHEITSAIYIVRNDYRAFCFLQYWRSYHPPKTPKKMGSRMIAVPNNCNGALIGAVIQLFPKRQLRKCLEDVSVRPGHSFSLEKSIKGKYRLNVDRKEVFDRDSYPEHKCMYRMQHFGYHLGTAEHELETSMGVYVLWIGEGLWRSHERPMENENAPQFYMDRFRTCYPSSDLIGHGDKAILTHMYTPEHSARCYPTFKSAHDYSASALTPDQEGPGQGANPHCTWLKTRKEEVDLLSKYCVFNSPACYSSSFSSLSTTVTTNSINNNSDNDQHYDNSTSENRCIATLRKEKCWDMMHILPTFLRRLRINYALYSY